LREEAINPRSPDLRYFGGNAVWRFEGGRELVVAFSNSSSIEPTVRVYLPDSVVEISHAAAEGDVFIHTNVWRTSGGSQTLNLVQLFEGRLPGVRLFMEGIGEALHDVFDRGATRAPGLSGAMAVAAVIGALVSSREGVAVRLPIDPGSVWGVEQWPIS
jgi:hypothetical protein